MKILTLSGWTQPAEALKVIAPEAEMLDYVEHTPESILSHKGDYDLVIGWSLGGILARQLLKNGAIKADALVSIAAPYQFVRSAELHEAMPSDTFEQFYVNYRDDTDRTTARFHGLLIKGDANAKQIRGNLAHHPRIDETDKWLVWMDFLREYSAADHDYSSLPKTLIIHGEQDAIVPAAQAEHLKDKLGAALLLLPESGHAPHFHDAAKVRQAIRDFVK